MASKNTGRATGLARAAASGNKNPRASQAIAANVARKAAKAATPRRKSR